VALRAENRVVIMAGLVQPHHLGEFPAASSMFTNPTEYDLLGRSGARPHVQTPGGDGN
jgi:hypothetical protein